MSNLLATGLAYKALKSDKTEKMPTESPKNIQESIFAKPLTWAIIAGVAIYFGSKLFKNLSKKGSLIQTKEDILILQQTQKQSYLDSQYTAYADVLFTAMDGFGTDEDAIFRVFTAMKNDLDIAKLINAYGLRKDESLAEWLQGDLSSSDMAKLNKILSTKGIKYQF